ncbi:MAG: c-type cytochrome [Steroidobacteraceae bacterium]
MSRSAGAEGRAGRAGPTTTLLAVGLLAVIGAAAAQSPVAAAPAGVSNPQRAWQNWTLNCQGCHRPDGTGSAGTAPSLAGAVSKFLTVPGGREYLGRVPGVATSPLANADLAELMNWMVRRFDKEHMPADFLPFTAEEIGRLRTQPLRLEAAQMRNDLLKKADESAAP